MARIRFAKLRSDFPEQEDQQPRCSQFKSRIERTLEKLEEELSKIGVAQGVVELDCEDAVLRHCRKRRFPRNSEMNSQRVRLTFTHPKLGVLQYPCGTYRDYHGNLRAIVLTLEALRAIDRYGACGEGQQYEGFRELPPGEMQEQYFASAYEAAEFIAELAGKSLATAEALLEDPEYLAYCYKLAAKHAHPDSGGSDEKFKSLQQAKEVIQLENNAAAEAA